MCSGCNITFETRPGVLMHQKHRFSKCKQAKTKEVSFGAPAVNSEMGRARIDTSNSPDNSDNEQIVEQEAEADMEMHVEDITELAIEAEDNEEAPTPIAVWQELMEVDEPAGVNEELMAKIRICKNSDDFGDESRRKAIDLDNQNPVIDASSAYEDIRIQLVHDFIINNRLSTDAGDKLLELWTKVIMDVDFVCISGAKNDFDCGQTLGIEPKVKPTVRNLNSRLLKFVQGSEIFEQIMGIPDLDGKQAS